jgi:hypothetical protein
MQLRGPMQAQEPRQPRQLPTEQFGMMPKPSAPTGSTWHWRQNNPGNIRATPESIKAYPGAKQGQNGFLAFETPEQGIGAIGQTFRHIAKTRGVNTLRGIISVYAPKGDGANDPDAYAATVAKATGIDPDAPLDLSDPTVMARIVPALVKVETGTSGPTQRNVVPAGDRAPPPMMGLRAAADAPDLGPMAPAEPPGFFERNQELLGDIGGALSAFGQGISQAPPGAGWGTGLNLGFAGSSKFASGLGDRKLDEKLKKAQVGEVEAKAEQRKNLQEIAKSVSDPIASFYLKAGDAGKAIERLEKIDPNEAKRIADAAGLKKAAETRAEIAVRGPEANTQIAKLFKDRESAISRGDLNQVKAIEGQIEEENAKSRKAQVDSQVAESGPARARIAMQDFEKATTRIIGPDGKINRNVLAASDMNIPFTEGRTFKQEMKRSISSFIFAIAGKALTEKEWELTYEPLMPRYADTEEAIRNKMTRLRQNLDTFAARPSGAQPPTPAPPAQGFQDMGNGWGVRVR